MRTSTSIELGRFGDLGAGVAWKEVVEAYYRDDLAAAWAGAQALGANFGGATLDWYRMIEGEAETRERAAISTIDDHLRLELIDAEVPHRDALAEVAQQACSQVGQQLGWDYSVPVLVTVLPYEVDAPWHSARYGYAMDKYPYDKVCIPGRVTQDPEHVAAIIRHEFAHVVTLNRTGNQAPTWVEEGVSTWVEGTPRPVGLWRDVNELEASFTVDRRDPSTLHGVGDAYAQAHAMVSWLADKYGANKIADWLGAFGNNSFFTEARMRLTGESPADEALRETFGISENQVFRDARPD
jgi:hypothetical protein